MCLLCSKHCLVSFPQPTLLHNVVQNVHCTNLRVAIHIMNTPIIVHIKIYAALHTHSAPRIHSFQSRNKSLEVQSPLNFLQANICISIGLNLKARNSEPTKTKSCRWKHNHKFSVSMHLEAQNSKDGSELMECFISCKKVYRDRDSQLLF